jgi:hypothetical protein
MKAPILTTAAQLGPSTTCGIAFGTNLPITPGRVAQGSIATALSMI